MLSQCYNKDGSPSSDVPCDSAALVSACCSDLKYCATNLFCLDGNGERLTGSCSQQDWGISGPVECPCPAYAANTLFDPNINVTECVNSIYCCGSNNQACCDQGQGRLSVVYDAYLATATTSPHTTFVTTTSNTDTQHVSSIPNSDSESSSLMSLSSQTMHSSIVSGLNVTTTMTTSSASATGGATGGGASSFGQMGIGVALGLGTPLILILGACVFLFFRLRETRLKIKEGEGPIVRAKRSINTLREKRSMATLNENDERWI